MIAENRTFKNRRINLDGASFSSCQFNGCTLLFSGFMPVDFDKCTFANDCKWQFLGPAANMLEFMSVLYASGAKELIETSFKKIRGDAAGSSPTAP